MGFTTGFTGGLTLTLGVAYLTVLAHERNRQAQSQALRSQSRVLHGLLEPEPLPPPQGRAELAQEERSTLIETAKDRWNEEVENAVRWVQRTDWSEVREGMEGAVARLLSGGLQKSREGIEDAEKQAGPKIQEAVNRSRAAARQGAHEVTASLDRAGSTAVAGAERAGASTGETASSIVTSARSKAEKVVGSIKTKLDNAGERSAELRDSARAQADRAAADTKAAAHGAAGSISQNTGTVDAARSAVREVFSKGVEKGKEALGKAQAAVGLAQEKIESKDVLGSTSPVEKALNERYEKPDELNKTVKEVLDERYKPIESRDNTVLRGV